MPGEPEATKFKYEGKDTNHKKDVIRLCSTDSFKADVQIVREGGANNLHSHTGNDGFWMVLDGVAIFYGSDDEMIAKLERNEGILIPHGFKYWFESGSDTPLEILHVASYVEGVDDVRVDHEMR